MNFISNAYAQDASQSASSGMELLILAGVFFLIMYFVIIRPQNKRNKAHKELLESITAGTEVTTTGGLLGRVISSGENFITLEISSGIEIKVQKQSISAMMPKGTIKSIN